MPGEDGLSLARYIRQQHSEIPIIMLTGKGDLIDRVVGLETGADDYIPKPFELREVLARIRTVMRRAGPRATPAAPVPARNTSEVLVFEGWRLPILSGNISKVISESMPPGNASSRVDPFAIQMPERNLELPPLRWTRSVSRGSALV
jgi:DNA-binding response OmpR family regulator